MSNSENIKPYQFEKGRSKTGGRKKGSLNYNTRLERKLRQKITDADGEDNNETKTGIDWVLDGFIKRGAKGDPRVAELLHKWFEDEDPMNVILTLSQMTDEQLEQIANGEVPYV